VLFKPTPYKISTITATATLSCPIIDAELLSRSIKTSQEPDISAFLYVEYGEKNGIIYQDGFHKKMKITRRRRKETKRFDNQVTLLIRLINCTNTEMTNMKVFKNGNIQMTGLKSIDQGKRAIQFLIDHIKRTCVDITPPSYKDALTFHNYDIRLINSDFSVGFNIDRDNLYSILQKKYEVFCTYESCIYPGVKIQFNFNNELDTHDGVCRCSCKCNGKGNALGEGQCKKITIAVFQSGSIIITGARAIDQVNTAYNFILNIIKTHANDIKKISHSELLLATKNGSDSMAVYITTVLAGLQHSAHSYSQRTSSIC
jgi:TATA-box binding protein (TBP) (component of TFIID and TFIIIB)